MTPIFSIIIPTLNEEECLPLILGDIAAQSLSDYEVLVVDGKSEDKTQQVAKKFPKVAVLESPKRHVSIQRNLGARRSKGMYVLFFDADTRIGPDFLQELRAQLTENPSDISICWTKELGKKTANALIHSVINIGVELSKAIDQPTAQGSQMCFKRDVFNTIGGFNETISYAEDTEIVRRAVNLGYTFEVYRKPQFEYSLRRIKTAGLGKSLENYLKLGSLVMKQEYPTQKLKEYPMVGGKLYKKKQKAQAKQKKTTLTDLLQKIINQ